MTLALKEWPATIQALEQGKLIVLFRKGGIHDRGDQFSLPGPGAVLFPSYEHQKNEFLKSNAAPKTEAYQPNEHLTLQTWVEFVDHVTIPRPEIIPALNRHHIWTDEFLFKRFEWKPQRPLVCIFCRIFRLKEPVDIVYEQQYGGCRSFIEIKQTIDLNHRQAVLSEAAFMSHVQKVKSTLSVIGSYS